MLPTKWECTPAKAKKVVLATGIKKEYPEKINTRKITFRLPEIAAQEARNVYLVGDFNAWDTHASPMKKLKNGAYTITLELATGREYQYRYFIDECKWENDWNAAKYVKSPFGYSAQIN